MKLTFLGTGTSCGVPTLGCQCEVCRSKDPRDKRLRCSALLETANTRLLIDCGPDFRQQMMGQAFRPIDGILVTHAHYDHMGGMDDIRPYCQFGAINVYADPLACQGLLQMLPYCFEKHRYPGVPAIGLHELELHRPITIGDFEIVPFQVMHGKLPISGFRIGALTYITDMKTMAETELPYVEGTEVLVVNALRVGKPHHSHQLLADALQFAERIGARRTLLIHSSHDIGLHAKVNRRLPKGVEMAYDGQVIDIDGL